MDTRRHDDAQKMLETERLDVVQVCGRGDRIPHWARICLERGLPILAEKPLAMDLPTLGLETGTGAGNRDAAKRVTN